MALFSILKASRAFHISTRSSWQRNVDARKLVRLRRVEIGDRDLVAVSLRTADAGQACVTTADHVGAELHSVRARSGDWTENQVLLVRLLCNACDFHHEHRSRVSRVQTRHLLQQIDL